MSLRFLKSAARKVLFVLATGVVVLAIAWWAAQPGYPDGFYKAPAQIPTERGALLRIDAFIREIPRGARGWRILYTTTRADNSPAIASAIVVAPEQRRSGAYPVIAWAHGGTGIVPGCAPSVMAHPFGHAASGGAWALLPMLLAENWVYVATDYVGLGTNDRHAFLIGDEAARGVFDVLLPIMSSLLINSYSEAYRTSTKVSTSESARVCLSTTWQLAALEN
jgi:hypothetical protein